MTRKKFTFVSKALPEDTFSVISFKGVEGISRPYEFDITLVSEDPDIDLKELLKNPATFNINFEGQDFPVHGRLAYFEQVHEIPGHVCYRAVLVPRLWESGLFNGNQLFLDKTVPEVITEVLKQVGLTSKDYDLKLARTYPKWEYICQYQESHLNFLSRWMEREGIYYFFEQTEQGEKLIITDSVTGHQDIKGEKTIPYSPPSGIDHVEEEVIVAFFCRQRMLPNKVVLKDYNYRKPSLEIKAEAVVDSNGRGDVYLYGEHFKDPDQGMDLAKIRAEELLCREKVFYGEATASTLSPGFIFELAGHYRDSNNQRYLITEVEHNGRQTGAFLSALEGKPTDGKEELGYSNRFACIPASVQFRTERKTARPRFYGTMNATVDAAGDGTHAEIDDQGRYKVILPFDQSGNKDGKASRWIRMAQPYSGFNASDGIKGPSGMHFPLHKGAEVLLTFVDGDPDRPIISSSLPNPETVSPVTSANQTKSIIRDNYGNEIVMDATPGDEHIRIYSPHHNSGLELGRSDKVWTDSNKTLLTLGNTFAAGIGTSADFYGGAKTSILVGAKQTATFGLSSSVTAGLSAAIKFGRNDEWNYEKKSTNTKGNITQSSNADILSLSGKDHVLGAGDQICLVGGASGEKKARSIVNIYPESIEISTGGGIVKHKIPPPGEEFAENEQLYAKYLPSKDHWRSVVMTVVLLSAAAGTIAPPIIDGLVHGKKDASRIWDIVTMIIGSGVTLVGGLLALIAMGIPPTKWIAKKLKTEEPEAEYIEPVEHKDPAAKIRMDKTGGIEIESDDHIILKCGEKSKKTVHIQSDENGFVIYCRGSHMELNNNGEIQFSSEGDSHLKSHKGDIHITPGPGKKTWIKGLVDLG